MPARLYEPSMRQMLLTLCWDERFRQPATNTPQNVSAVPVDVDVCSSEERGRSETTESHFASLLLSRLTS